MKKAWVENSCIRDVCSGDPVFLFGAEIGSNYDTDVPDEVEHGWFLSGDIWTPPLIPDPVMLNSIPQSVTPRQARLVLALTPAVNSAFPHMLAQIESAFAELPEPQRTVAEITWEYSIAVERANPLIAQMQSLIGFSDTQIDELFIRAASL